MKKCHFFFLSVFLGFVSTGNTTPTSMVKGFLFMDDMVTSFIFDGSPYVSSSDNFYKGYLKAVGEPGWDRYISIEEQGSYGTQIPGTYVWTSIDSEMIESTIILLPDDHYNSSATSSASFSKDFIVDNLKYLSIDYGWNMSSSLSSDDYDEFSKSTLYTSLYLYSRISPESEIDKLYLTHTKTFVSAEVDNANDTFVSIDGRGFLSYTFDSPYSGILNIEGFYDLCSFSGSMSNNVPEPGLSALFFPGFILLISHSFFRKKRENHLCKH